MQNLGSFPEEDSRTLEEAARKELRSCHLFALMLAELQPTVTLSNFHIF